MSTLAVSVEVGAIIKDGLKTAFSQVETASATLGNEIARLNRTAATMSGWRDAKRQTADARQVWQSAERQAAALGDQLSKTDQPSEQLRAELAKAKTRVDLTKTAWREAASQLRRFDGDMKAAGIDAKSYGATMGKVDTAVQRLTKSQNALTRAKDRADSARAKRNSLKGELLGVGAMAGSVAYPVIQAIKFQAAMAGVRKVTNMTREETNALGRDMRRALAASNIPLDRIEAAGIMEAAGQAGLGKTSKDLIDFTTDVAKAKIALDMTSEQAGSAFAGWRSSMKLSQAQAMSLGDAVNHLSNNSNAVASDLVNVISRQGAVAKTAGLAEHSIAALGAFMLSSNQGPEMTATALKNLTGSLSAGIAATGRQKDAFAALGYSATDLASRMQNDAEGTIVDFFQTLSEQAPEDQRSLLSMVVGEESLGVIAPLLTNLDGLRHSFRLVANEADYAGSMQSEFDNRTSETDMDVKNAWIAINDLATVFGKSLTPAVSTAARAVAYGANALSSLIEDYPHLTSAVAIAAGAFVGFRVASLAVRFVTAQTRLTMADMTLAYRRVGAAATVASVRMSSWSLGGMVSSIGSLGTKMIWLARSPIKAVMMGMRMLKVAALTNPITLIPTVLGFVAELALTHWETLTKWVKVAIDWIGKALDAVPLLGTAWEYLFGGDDKGKSKDGKGKSGGPKAKNAPSGLHGDMPGLGDQGAQMPDGVDPYASDSAPSISLPSTPSGQYGGSQTIENNQHYEINIYAKPGEDIDAIADKVMRKIREQNDGALYDNQ